MGRAPLVAIAMTTSYASSNQLPARQRSCLRTIRLARRLNYPVVIIDHASHPRFITLCRAQGASVNPQRTASSASARIEAITAAAGVGTEFVYWTEDDKPALIRAVPHLVDHALIERAVVAIPYRSSLRHYPPFEAAMYNFGRSLAVELLRTPLDLFLGSTLIAQKECGRWTERTDERCPWRAIHAPRLALVEEGKRVVSMGTHFERSRSLWHEERGNRFAADKRATQLHALTKLFYETFGSWLTQPRPMTKVQWVDGGLRMRPVPARALP